MAETTHNSAIPGARRAALERRWAATAKILADALSVDSAIDWDALATVPPAPAFRTEKPRREDYLPDTPAGFGKMLPWKKSVHEALRRKGEQKYRQAEAQYREAKRQHKLKVEAEREQAEAQRQKIADLKARFEAGEVSAVESYFGRVLAASEYPASFPRCNQLTYSPDWRHLALEVELPTFADAPGDLDKASEAGSSPMVRTRHYASVLAQVALCAMREIVRADRTEKVTSIEFKGYARSRDRQPGLGGDVPVIAVDVARTQLLDPDLAALEPEAAIKRMGGRVSSRPEALVPIAAADHVEEAAPMSLNVAALNQALEDAEARPSDDVYQRMWTARGWGGYSIPEREPVAPAGVSSPGGAYFVEQARRLVDRTEPEATERPFQHYWPTYDSMDKAQRRWYFYWRAQARRGNCLPADVSYLYLHVYEAINLVGFDTPESALSYLKDFWRFYRQSQPKLDDHLPDWIADFIVWHELAPDALAWYGEAARLTELRDTDLAVEIWWRAGADIDALPIKLLFRLATYHPKTNKYYKLYRERSALDSAYKRGVAAVDAAMRGQSGKSLFAAFRSGEPRVIRRQPFIGAPHPCPYDTIEVARAHRWRKTSRLVNTLRQVLRHTENVLRERDGYGYKLRKIQLDKRWRRAIERAFTPQAPKPELSIDLARVARLSQESQALRERLLADEAESETPDPAADALLEAAMWQPRAHEPEPGPKDPARRPRHVVDWTRIGRRRRARAARLDRLYAGDCGERAKLDEKRQAPAIIEADRPDGRSSDLDQIARVIGGGGSQATRLLAEVMRAGWDCDEARLQAALPGEFISVVIEDINSRALEEIGDTLLVEEGGRWVALDDYRDEIERFMTRAGEATST